MTIRLYCYPNGSRRLLGFIAAPSLKAARGWHPEAMLATHDQVCGILVELLAVQRVSANGREDKQLRFAEASDFGLEKRGPL